MTKKSQKVALINKSDVYYTMNDTEERLKLKEFYENTKKERILYAEGHEIGEHSLLRHRAPFKTWLLTRNQSLVCFQKTDLKRKAAACGECIICMEEPFQRSVCDVCYASVCYKCVLKIEIRFIFNEIVAGRYGQYAYKRNNKTYLTVGFIDPDDSVLRCAQCRTGLYESFIKDYEPVANAILEAVVTDKQEITHPYGKIYTTPGLNELVIVDEFED